MKIVKIDLNNNLLREFLKNVLECEFGISNSLKQELNRFDKNISDLTEIEVEELSSVVFISPPIFNFYNLEDDNGNLIFPVIYNDFFNESQFKDLFCIGKFGIQCIDLFNGNGKLLYKDAFWIDFHSGHYIEIMDQNSVIKIYRYRTNEQDLELLGSPKNNLLGRFISFDESRYYFNGGYVDENFNYTTPLCFDNGKFFSEGLAPVCLNGKWGYINRNSHVVIDFIYGNAEPFKNGIAKVFVLNSEFQNEKGVWVESNLDEGYSPTQFLELFPIFPKMVRKPICIIRGNSKTSEELNKNYHYYAEGVIEDYGNWVEINSKGEIINSKINHELNTIKPLDLELIPNTNPDYWFNYIIENSNNYNIISELPDLLFVDKIFVLRILERLPNLFHFFACLFSDDDDIAELVFNLSYRNFDFFSDRLRLVYQNRYDEKMTEEGQQLFDTVIPNQNLDDDLPF